MPSQLDRIQVRRGADTEHPDQFMLASIKAALAGVGLYPSDEIEHCPIDAAARDNQHFEVAPIHACEVHRSIHRGFGCGGERFTKKSNESITRHLARCHGKLAMLHGPASHDTADHHVVGWIEERHVSSLTSE